MKAHTILCVEDKPHVLQTLRCLLQPEGYRIVTTTGGKEVLDSLGMETLRQLSSIKKILNSTVCGSLNR